MKFKFLFFDLDGTLTDPGIGITNCVMYALNKFGIEENDRTRLYRFIGPPLVDSFMEFYGFTKEQAWDALLYYRERFGEVGLFENEVYEGIIPLLQRLTKEGYTLCVATSKPTEYSLRILEKFQLLDYFAYVSGSSMDEHDSSKAAIISKAMREVNASPEDVLMIGDRRHDIEGAKSCNVKSLGVLYGYGDREEHLKAGADYIVETVDQIYDLLREE